MGISKKRLAGCLEQVSVMLVFVGIAWVVWLFRVDLSKYFFGHNGYASVIGLLIFTAIPFLGFIFYFVIKNQK